MDRESYAAYGAYVAAFVADYSVAMALFPLGMFCYALVAARPSVRYWKVRHAVQRRCRFALRVPS
jgi:hypothetical protein